MTGAVQSSGRDPPDDSQAPARPSTEAPPTLYDVVGAFVRDRLADLVDLAMVILITACLAVALANQSFKLTSGLLAGSIIAAALSFLLASRSLRRCEGIGYERIFVAAAAMAGGIMLFELFYHLGWPDSWRVIDESITTFGLELPNRAAPFPILWSIMAFTTVFVGARYMRVNRWVVFVGTMAAAWFALWIAVGYPNAFLPWRWPESTLVFQVIPTEYAHPTNPSHPGWAVVSTFGAFFATVAKLFIYAFPATLFAHHLGRAKSGDADRPDDVLAVAWNAAVASRLYGEPHGRAEEPARSGRLALKLSAWGAPVARSLQRAGDFLLPKAADIGDLFMFGVIVVSVALVLIRQSLLLTDGLLAGSLIGFALSYLFASRSLRNHEELRVQRMFIGLCALVSSMWLFEIFFHYWGSNQFNRFWDGFTAWNLAAPWKPFALVWALIMVSLVLVGARYMRINRYFVITLAVAVSLFWTWKAIGFPTFKNPHLWPQHNPPYLPLIPLEYALAPTPEAAAVITYWGLLFNTIAKIAWCMLPGTLFLTRENLGGSLRDRLWPPGPALKSLCMPWTHWGKPVALSEAGPPAHDASPARHLNNRRSV